MGSDIIALNTLVMAGTSIGVIKKWIGHGSRGNDRTVHAPSSRLHEG